MRRLAASLGAIFLAAWFVFIAIRGGSPRPSVNWTAGDRDAGLGHAQLLPQRNDAPPPGFEHYRKVEQALEDCKGLNGNGRPCGRLPTGP